MQKIDRLGWTAGFQFSVHGIHIGIRATQPEILAELKRRLPIGWKPKSTPKVDVLFSLKVGGEGHRPGLRQFHLLYGNFVRLIRTHNLADALDTFETRVQMYVAEFARNRIFVHAGVIGWNGQALVIPGLSLSGKSTLVRELVKAGATYYSDEYAVLDAKGRVYPYPLPIGLRKSPRERQEKLPIETFGGVVGARPLPIGLILATEFKEGARWRPKAVSAGQGLMAIMANTVSAQHNPAKALATLQQVVLKAPVLKGTRGETAEVVEALLNRPWPTL
jgi:hypothetical protein